VSHLELSWIVNISHFTNAIHRKDTVYILHCTKQHTKVLIMETALVMQ